MLPNLLEKTVFLVFDIVNHTRRRDSNVGHWCIFGSVMFGNTSLRVTSENFGCANIWASNFNWIVTRWIFQLEFWIPGIRFFKLLFTNIRGKLRINRFHEKRFRKFHILAPTPLVIAQGSSVNGTYSLHVFRFHLIRSQYLILIIFAIGGQCFSVINGFAGW